LADADAMLPVESVQPPPLSVVRLEALLLDAAIQLGDADVLASLGTGGSGSNAVRGGSGSSAVRVGSQWLAQSATKALTSCMMERVARSTLTPQSRGSAGASALMLDPNGHLLSEIGYLRAAEEKARHAHLILRPLELSAGTTWVQLEIQLGDLSSCAANAVDSGVVDADVVEAQMSESSSECSSEGDRSPDAVPSYRMPPRSADSSTASSDRSAPAPSASPPGARHTVTAPSEAGPCVLGTKVAIRVAKPSDGVGWELHLDVVEDVVEAAGGEAASSEGSEGTTRVSITEHAHVGTEVQGAYTCSAAEVLDESPRTANGYHAGYPTGSTTTQPPVLQLAHPPPPPLPPRRSFPGSPVLVDFGASGALSSRTPDWSTEWWGYWPACCGERRRRDRPDVTPQALPSKTSTVLNVGFGGSPLPSGPFSTPLIQALTRHYERLLSSTKPEASQVERPHDLLHTPRI